MKPRDIWLFYDLKDYYVLSLRQERGDYYLLDKKTMEVVEKTDNFIFAMRNGGFKKVGKKDNRTMGSKTDLTETEFEKFIEQYIIFNL